MYLDSLRQDRLAAAVIATVIIVNGLLFFLSRDQTYVHIDAIAHVNKARGLFDNLTPGIRQLGSVWLPLQHLLIAPLAWFDFLWRTGLAGSLLSAACFVGTSVLLLSTAMIWTGTRFAGWMAFLLFVFNPRLIYFFTTPMTEPLMIFCIAGFVYYLIQWAQTSRWRPFAMAALMVFAGTLTRYEGWAVAAAAIVLIPVVARKQRIESTILFAGAAVAGPMLWMLFNMVYFDDPLMFGYGIGSAAQIADGHRFPPAGDWAASIQTFFINVAYCVNPIVLWMGVAGVALSIYGFRYGWRPASIVALGAGAPFGFYVFNLYSNQVPLLMPGFMENDPNSVYNVRYGTVMAATVPLFAAFALNTLAGWIERNRRYALVFLVLPFLPDPVPWQSLEPMNRQFTDNLFYYESVRNQSFWLPPFVEVAHRLKADIEARKDKSSYILTNTRIVHPVVWATGIPMKRFVHEMNEGWWMPNLSRIDARVRWVITEEGDQLWHARGKFMQANFVEVAQARTEATGIVHLYRRPD